MAKVDLQNWILLLPLGVSYLEKVYFVETKTLSYVDLPPETLKGTSSFSILFETYNVYT